MDEYDRVAREVVLDQKAEATNVPAWKKKATNE